MIRLTKLNRKEFFLNCDLIETVEATPDTVIALQSGKLYIVAESPGEVAAAVLEYRRSLYAGLLDPDKKLELDKKPDPDKRPDPDKSPEG